MKPIRWGILGAAKFARQHMGPAIQAAEGAELAALATSSRDKAAPFAAFAPGLRVHDSYDALLADPGIDAVYIPLPNHLHVDWALRALDAGKHVLVEKPLAMNAAAFDAVIAARDATGLQAAEAYMIVHHPQWQMARDIVQGGGIGDLCQVDAVFSYDNRADGGNIRNRPETGGGGIPDIGVYPYGAVRFVTGEEPARIVSAEIDWENGVDVWARVCARFPSFAFHAVTSMRMHPRQEMTFHGTEGVLHLPVPFNAGVFGQAEVHLRRGMDTTITRFPMVNHYVLQVQHFGAAIRGEAAFACPLEFSRGTQAMIDMVFETRDVESA